MADRIQYEVRKHGTPPCAERSGRFCITLDNLTTEEATEALLLLMRLEDARAQLPPSKPSPRMLMQIIEHVDSGTTLASRMIDEAREDVARFCDEMRIPR